MRARDTDKVDNVTKGCDFLPPQQGRITYLTTELSLGCGTKSQPKHNPTMGFRPSYEDDGQ